MASKPSLTLKRRLKAPAEKVFQAWTKPEQMIRWWGRMGEGTSTAETDVRVGGSFHVAFKDNTGEKHEVSGKYREVVPDRKLVFSWAWYTTPERESLVTIDLKPDGDGTILTLIHEQFFDQKACDDHRGGWMRALDNLESIFP